MPESKSNKTVFIVVGGLLLVAVLAVAVYFLTKESKEEKALQAVCGARQDIKAKVVSLATTTPQTFTLEKFKSDVTGITDDLETIKTNEAKLKPNRKQEIQAANEQFKDALTTTITGLGTSISVKNAKTKFAEAGQELITSYKNTLEPVDCTGVDTGS
jgi:flagellar basal body-associated protein FliL